MRDRSISLSSILEVDGFVLFTFTFYQLLEKAIYFFSGFLRSWRMDAIRVAKVERNSKCNEKRAWIPDFAGMTTVGPKGL